MNVLLIEDDYSTARAIEIALLSQNINCDKVILGQSGLEASVKYNYDVIILDLMLPDMYGYEVILRLRSAHVDVPILVLSGIASVEEKIKCLGYGADDYLTKPFNRIELVARIQAMTRRYKKQAA